MTVHKNKELFKNSPGPLAENFPPQQAPQIYLPAQTVFEQTSFMAEHMSEPNRWIEDNNYRTTNSKQLA
jgi:hypothetical protein